MSSFIEVADALFLIDGMSSSLLDVVLRLIYKKKDKEKKYYQGYYLSSGGGGSVLYGARENSNRISESLTIINYISLQMTSPYYLLTIMTVIFKDCVTAYEPNLTSKTTKDLFLASEMIYLIVILILFSIAIPSVH